jgi:hypothetical protein
MERDLFDIFPDLPWRHIAASRPRTSSMLLVTRRSKRAPVAISAQRQTGGTRRHPRVAGRMQPTEALGAIHRIAQEERARLAPEARRQSVGLILTRIIQIASRLPDRKSR